ncbi:MULTISPECIES: RNA chaperone ProQ [Gammaproteobacteria]|uniref:RNA chaperone ProQ n=1 Tax=Gammaproteobacteria TaxID=1236 RepID=UPI000DD03750|nr:MULTISPECIES: RNA chaperone ProQ [Gammaproteobacteria]RTE87210.1 RNA chaperone ProQ [Aliidiomarina sp. B3213]TCZ93002.1 RNA chaperone ProQ [Lysobacter sp. N42]
MTNKEEVKQEENSAKLPNSKEVIAYLAEQFPKCFTLEGEAKPLKIGIFEDLASRLAEDEKVSKTRLRVALRQYTNSWRYLRCVKQGVERVDLDGGNAGTVETDHEEHAKETLEASKAKANAKRKEQQKDQGKAAKPGTRKPKPKNKPNVHKRKLSSKPSEKVVVQTEAVKDLSQLTQGQKVQVKFGKSQVFATVTTIDKTEAQVQLDSGMTLKVSVSDLYEVK